MSPGSFAATDTFMLTTAITVLAMGGAVIVTFLGYGPVLKRARPVFESTFDIPTNRQIDMRLIARSGIFVTHFFLKRATIKSRRTQPAQWLIMPPAVAPV